MLEINWKKGSTTQADICASNSTQEDNFAFPSKKTYGFYLLPIELSLQLANLDSDERHKEVIILQCVYRKWGPILTLHL